MRDSDVREAVLARLERVYSGDDKTYVVEEMGVWSGSVRVDIAVINGELSGIELKSDRDTLGRLSFQSEIYSKVFDRVELVVGKRHADKIHQAIPDWWKITVATQVHNTIRLETVRDGTRNPKPDPFLIAQLLWKEEALTVLEKLNLAKGWRSKRVKHIHQRLASELSLTELGEHVRHALKHRKGWLRQVMPRQFYVSIDPDLNPGLQISGRQRLGGNTIDPIVCPAMSKGAALGMRDDLLRVPDELLIHVDAAEAGRSHAATNQKLTVTGVANIDRESPCNPLGRCVRRYRGIIAVIKRVWQAKTT